jgi:hypothetical protein
MRSDACHRNTLLAASLAFATFTFLLLPHTVSAQNKRNAPPPRPPAMHSAPPPRPAPRPAGPSNNTNRNQGGSMNRPSPQGHPPNAGRLGLPPNRNPGTTPGMNRGSSNPPSSVNRFPGPAGNPSVANRGGFGNRPQPARTFNLKSGGSASVRPNGRLRTIDRNGMHIDYTGRGTRTVSTMRGGARVVTTGAHQGFVQRSISSRNGRSYVQRTYVVNNRTRTVVYRSYSYRGASYYGYAPAYYYRPAFYGWAYNPWPAPIFWSWGWTTAAYPWYGYYGSYFSPYPAYPSAAYWLTDYLVAADLEAAYAARTASANAASPADASVQQDDTNASPSRQSATLSPQVKQAITEEVKAELQREQNSAAQSQAAGGAAVQGTVAQDDTPPALDPALRTFVVASDLDVVASDQECTLTPGDVITRLGDTPDENQKVIASVASSKKPDCAAGQQVLVAVQDLQEMQNHFREQLDSGLKELAAKQGNGGLPHAPDATQVAGEVPPPVADATAARMLQDQEATADQTERDTSTQVSGQGS